MRDVGRTAQAKDVFNAFLSEGALYQGKWEIPRSETATKIPTGLVSFEKLCERKYTSYIHFYCHDYKFECIWRDPKKYLEKIKPYAGIISPDYSLYRDLPLCMQLWNTYRNRALSHWFVLNGIPVIPNVRWGDERSWEFCFTGIPQYSVVSIGSHGCLKTKLDREYFSKGLAEMVKRVKPSDIIVYGRAPETIFGKYQEKGVNIHQYDSSFHLSRIKERS